LSGGADSFCKTATDKTASPERGFRIASLFDEAPTAPIGPFKKDPGLLYCSGEETTKANAGKVIDGGGGTGMYRTGEQPGKPYPCKREYVYNLGLCNTKDGDKVKHGKGSVGLPGGACDPNLYDRKFLMEVTGSDLMKCNASGGSQATSVTCQLVNDTIGCWDMDQIIFACFFKGYGPSSVTVKTTWNGDDGKSCKDCNAELRY